MLCLEVKITWKVFSILKEECRFVLIQILNSQLTPEKVSSLNYTIMVFPLLTIHILILGSAVMARKETEITRKNKAFRQGILDQFNMKPPFECQ
jgi:uncharacterized membrane protein